MFDKKQQFKDRLNMALAIRELRPKDLAARTGLSESTISQYRSGYAEPKIDKIALIASALNINPVWLLGYSVPIELHASTRDLTPIEIAILDNYNSASFDIQEAVCAILKIKKEDMISNSSKVASNE